MDDASWRRYADDALRMVASDENGDDETYKEVLSRYNPQFLKDNANVRELLGTLVGICGYLVQAIAYATGATFEIVIDELLLDLVRGE